MAAEPMPRAVLPLRALLDGLVELGGQLTFFGRGFAYIPFAVKHYRKEIGRLLSDISWGRALLVGGGIMGVMLLLSAFVGTSVGIAGFTGLDIIGLAPFAGFVSALANTREFAPLIAATAFAAQAAKNSFRNQLPSPARRSVTITRTNPKKTKPLPSATALCRPLPSSMPRGIQIAGMMIAMAIA